MITAVDTSVLLDVFTADRDFGEASRARLAACSAEGSLIAAGIVWAEVTAAFESRRLAEAALETLGIGYSPLDRAAAGIAGEAWRAYRKRGGSRERVLADFIIGAHAHVSAERLLTRDRGFYRKCFKSLRVLDPSTPDSSDRHGLR